MAGWDKPMENTTLLQNILTANSCYLAGKVQLLEDSGPFFLIITCIDPRLTGLLVPALGLPRGRAMIIRTAGNRISASSHDIQKSVASAMYVRGVREIFVVGHSDCAMAAFPTEAAIESFRNSGVPRSAFGDGDIREWFGAFGDIRANVIESIGNLAQFQTVSPDAKLHGLLMDTLTGKLEVLRDGYISGPAAGRAARADSASAESSSEPSAAKPASGSSLSDHGSGGGSAMVSKTRQVPPATGIHTPPPAQFYQPESTAEAMKIVADFFHNERQNPRLKNDLHRMRELLAQKRNPLEILAQAARIAGENAVRYPKLPGAIEYLALQFKAANSGDQRISGILSQLIRF
jgi:carbonic anhydrase